MIEYFHRIIEECDQMALTKEDFLAISQLLDAKLNEKLKPVENHLKRIEMDLLENNIIPRLGTIESCYTDTYHRYREYTNQIEFMIRDLEILKKVVTEHSEKLQRL